jgi:ribosomal protein S8
MIKKRIAVKKDKTFKVQPSNFKTTIDRVVQHKGFIDNFFAREFEAFETGFRETGSYSLGAWRKILQFAEGPSAVYRVQACNVEVTR